MKRTLKLLAWVVAPVVVLAILLAAPIAAVESFCRGDVPPADARTRLIADPAHHRPEARTYLAYPEWHIVYAYDGLAEAAANGGTHRFDYLSSIAGFWTSLCDLSARADAHGGAGFAAKATAYTIGASFTLELALKALYEESIGRLVAWAGGTGTPQDGIERAVAVDYAAFLRQTPWYRYDFDAATARLWSEPAGSLRGWERRLALGAEWKVKAAYARLIEGAVGAVGADALTIRTVVSGLSPDALARLPGVEVIETLPEGEMIETPRYREYTEILASIAALGGDVREIAGNDDILLSVHAGPTARGEAPAHAVTVARVSRSGFSGDRLLLETRVTTLAEILRALPAAGLQLEHVYDY